MASIRSHKNHVHAPKPDFHILLLPMPRYSEWSLPFTHSSKRIKNAVLISPCTAHLLIIDLITLMISGED